MGIAGRYFLGQAARSTVAALSLLWPLFWLSVADRSIERVNPLIALRPGLVAVLGAVSSAPIVFALAAAGATGLFLARLEASGELCTLEASGSPRWSALRWALVPAALLSSVSLLLLWRIHPQATSALHGTSWLSSDAVPELLERIGSGAGTGTAAYSGRARPDGTIERFRLLLAGELDQPLGLACDRARVRLEDSGELELELGRGTALHGGGEPKHVRFERARLRLDLAALTGREQGSWSRRDARPWSSLSQDARIAGMVRGEHARRMRNGYLFEPWFRLALGLFPLVAAAQVLSAFLPRWAPPAAPARAVAAFAAVCLPNVWLVSAARNLAPAQLAGGFGCLAAALVVPAGLAWVATSLAGRRS